MGVVYCYIYPDFADFEVTVLLHRLRNTGGRRIVTIAETLEPVLSQSGLRYLPDRLIAQADADGADALVIPGGPIRNEQNAILPLVRAMDERGKLLAAICFGPQFLARAGVLQGRCYTTSCKPETAASQPGGDPFPRHHFRGGRVVQDGHVITAQGYAPVDFAAAVCRWLEVYHDARREYAELWQICDTDAWRQGPQ